MQSRDAIRAIKERLNITDIVRRYVDLKRNGPRWVAPCPFHQETKPSFSVNEEQGLFYCFGCQASGDIFDFYGRINGLDFRETLEQLAAEAGISLDRGPVDKKRQEEDRQRRSSRQTMLRMYELAAAHFAAALKSPEAEECRDTRRPALSGLRAAFARILVPACGAVALRAGADHGELSLHAIGARLFHAGFL